MICVNVIELRYFITYLQKGGCLVGATPLTHLVTVHGPAIFKSIYSRVISHKMRRFDKESSWADGTASRLLNTAPT